MKKKLNLNHLKVTSFTTEVEKENQKTVKGGVTEPFCTTWMVTNGMVILDCWVTDAGNEQQ